MGSIFHVGDEVVTHRKDRGVITYVGIGSFGEIIFTVLSYTGKPYSKDNRTDPNDIWRKTGRCFPQIAEVLVELKKSHDEMEKADGIELNAMKL